MLRIEVDTPRPPVFVYNIGTYAQVGPTIFPVTLTLSAKERTKVGGLKAAWQTTIQRPLAGRSIQIVQEWGAPEVLETLLMDVQGEFWVGGTTKTCTFTLSLPSTLPPTCTTDFEQITHTLIISCLAPSPEYSEPISIDRTISESSSTSSQREKRSFFGFKNHNKASKASPPQTPAEKPKPFAHTMEAPLPPSFSPSLLIWRKAIKVVTPLFPKDATPFEEIDKTVHLPEVGILRYFLSTGYMTLGSMLYLCCRFTDLNPLATIYTVTYALEQKVTSPDEQEIHADRYILEVWECAADKKDTLGYLWRGTDARIHAGDDPTVQGHAGATADELHLNGGPRMPSSAIGAQVTSGVQLETKVSTITHQLVVETTYSIYEQSPTTGTWVQGKKLQSTLRRNVTVGDCSLCRPTIQTPRYMSTANDQHVNPEKYLEPYTDDYPTTFSIPRISSIIREGKPVGRPKLVPKCSVDKIRAHQKDTNAFCMCFFETEAAVPPPGSGLNLIDTMDLLEDDEWGPDEAWIDNQRDRAIAAWRKRNPNARENVPGFVFVFLTDCPCEDITSESAQRLGQKPGITFRSEERNA